MFGWLLSGIGFLVLWFICFTWILGVITDVPNPSKLLKYFVEFIVLISILFFIAALFCGTMFLLFLFQNIIALV